MAFLTGEFECKLDNKGRMLIPAGLKKKLPEAESEGLVINRGFGEYLVIYTKKQWEDKLADLTSKLNEYDEEDMADMRYFVRGAAELEPDAAGRVNLPASLLKHAGIANEVVITCLPGRIELWAADKHENNIKTEPKDFKKFAEKMGVKGKEGANG
jgi:MraZ protein